MRISPMTMMDDFVVGVRRCVSYGVDDLPMLSFDDLHEKLCVEKVLLESGNPQKTRYVGKDFADRLVFTCRT